MRNRRRIPVGTIIINALTIVGLVVFFCAWGNVGGATGAQSESDAINGVIKPYFDTFSAVPAGSPDFPPSAEAETELIEMWDATTGGSACATYAKASLALAASMGDFAETGEAAYLEGAILILPQMEALEYACLIEA